MLFLATGMILNRYFLRFSDHRASIRGEHEHWFVNQTRKIDKYFAGIWLGQEGGASNLERIKSFFPDSG